MIDLLHENQMLKESLNESRKQLDKVKRTLKFTQINELKIENKVLNDELLRLRKVIDVEIPTLSPKNSKSLSKISEMDEENSNLKEKIEELERQVNEFQIKANIQSSREEEYSLLLNSMNKNETQLNELKMLIESLKNIIKEKDSVIADLNSKIKAPAALEDTTQGFSRMKSMAAKQPFQQKPNKDDAEQVIPPKPPAKEDVDKNIKGKDEFYKFLAREDSFSDVELIKLKDLAHLATNIEFWFQVFEK